MTIVLDWNNLDGGKPVKDLKKAFARTGTFIVTIESDERVRRSSGVAYKTLNLSFSDGQKIGLDIKETGDVFAVRLNNRVMPIKNHEDLDKAVVEMIDAMDRNRAAFQKRQARKKVELPKGMKSTPKKQEEKLDERITQLDTEIAEATKKRDELKGKLGLDSVVTVGSEGEAPLTISALDSVLEVHSYHEGQMKITKRPNNDEKAPERIAMSVEDLETALDGIIDYDILEEALGEAFGIESAFDSTEEALDSASDKDIAKAFQRMIALWPSDLQRKKAIENLDMDFIKKDLEKIKERGNAHDKRSADKVLAMFSDGKALDGVNYSPKVEFEEFDGKQDITGGKKQIAFVGWKSLPSGAGLAEATDADRKEFGRGTFRFLKGTMPYESIVKIDPKKMMIYFIDNDHYEKTDGEVKWGDSDRIAKLIVRNKKKFEEAFSSRFPALDGGNYVDSGALDGAASAAAYASKKRQDDRRRSESKGSDNNKSAGEELLERSRKALANDNSGSVMKIDRSRPSSSRRGRASGNIKRDKQGRFAKAVGAIKSAVGLDSVTDSSISSLLEFYKDKYKATGKELLITTSEAKKVLGSSITGDELADIHAAMVKAKFINEKDGEFYLNRSAFDSVFSQQEEGITMSETKALDSVNAALAKASEISGIALDGVSSFASAREILTQALDACNTNQKINLKEGNLEQAQLELANSEEFEAAINALDAVEASLVSSALDGCSAGHEEATDEVVDSEDLNDEVSPDNLNPAAMDEVVDSEDLNDEVSPDSLNPAALDDGAASVSVSTSIDPSGGAEPEEPALDSCIYVNPFRLKEGTEEE